MSALRKHWTGGKSQRGSLSQRAGSRWTVIPTHENGIDLVLRQGGKAIDVPFVIGGQALVPAAMGV
jgi:hypothetical protein